jgi:HEAT repeat protein
MRYAAARVIGRVFAWREHDDPIDAPVGDGVITALNDKDRSVKAAAMRALGALRYERSVQALTDLFAFYGSGDMAEAALGALAHIAHASSAPLFVTQLGAKSPAVRAIAIEGLARIGDATSLPKITAAADSDSTDLVALAASFANVLLANGPVDRIADALTHARVHDRARDYLTEIAPGRSASFARFLLDPDERIRQGIVEALAVAGDPAALPLLEPLLQDRDPQVARLAERAVARLRARSAGA